MKDLIIVGAYCPDIERENLLNNFIDSLQSIREKFDIIICSHIIIPDYITKKVDYVFFDKNNDLITDNKFMNQPWFSPWDKFYIYSTYVAGPGTYLAVYRLLMAGLGFAKIFNYEKAHYIEYDSYMKNYEQLIDNSEKLNEYDYVCYQHITDEKKSILFWPVGNFISFKVNTINPWFYDFNREKLLELSLLSESKANEKITYDKMRENNGNVCIKDVITELCSSVEIKLSDLTYKNSMSYWVVPFYNPKTNKVNGIIWNNIGEESIDVLFIINKTKIESHLNIEKSVWKVFEIGEISEINQIIIIINGKIKINLDFDFIDKKVWLETNYSTQE